MPFDRRLIIRQILTSFRNGWIRHSKDFGYTIFVLGNPRAFYEEKVMHQNKYLDFTKRIYKKLYIK